MKSFRSSSGVQNNIDVGNEKSVNNMKNKKSADKSAKKSGLFGGLFGSNKGKVSEEDLYNTIEDTSGSMDTGKSRKSLFGGNQAKQNKMVKQTNEVSKPTNTQKLMTDSESKVLYNTQLMNQTIFLYAEPSYWGQFQRYISIYDKVICLGTSDVNILEKQFRSDNLSNIILLFMFNISEVEPVASFLSKLDLESLTEGLLTILIVRDKGLDISKLHEVPGFDKYCSVGVVNKDQIVQQTIISIMGTIIKKQSPYPDVKMFKFPEKADKQLYHTTNGVTGLNLDYIMSVVNKARSDTSSAVVMETVKKQLVLSQSDSVTGLSLVQNNVPYLKFISDLCDNNDKKIQELRNNPRLKKEFETAINDKIALCAINTKEVKETVRQFIETAKEEMNSVMTELEAIEPEDIEEWEKMNLMTSEMMEKRNKMRDNIQKKYKMYMTQAKLVLACQQVEQRICANVNNLLVNTLKVDGANISTNNVSLIRSITNKMKELQEEAKNASEEVKKELVRAFNMSNALLEESSKLIEVDDILFKSLQAEIDILSRNQNVKLKVDSRLKERATLIYNFKDSGLFTMLNLVLDNQDLLVSVGKSSEDDFLGVGELKIKSSALIDSNLESLMEAKKLIEIQWNMESSENNDFILTAIDYLSSFCRKVYIVINAYDEMDKDVNEVEELIRNSVAKVCYFTDVYEARMLHVNYYYNQMRAYSNIVIHDVTYNKFVKDETDLDMLYKSAGFSQSVKMLKIPMLPSVAKGLKPTEKVLSAIKNIVYNM